METVTVGDVAFVPLRNAVLLKHEQTGVLDVVGRHWVAQNEPALGATLVKYVGRDFVAPLTREENSRLFDMTELLAFAGLCTREYFGGPPGAYCSRHNFNLYLYERPNLDTGFKLRTRRRDGYVQHLAGPGVHREMVPLHVSPIRPVKIDAPVLLALDKAMRAGGARWPRIYESILGFNLANTDSSDISPAAELIFLLGAFQRLLTDGYQCTELCQTFLSVLRPSVHVALAQAACSRWVPNRVTEAKLDRYKPKSIREAWLQDMCHVRNMLAHGKLDSKSTSLWSLSNHLLLASYVFPLVLKSVLARNQRYTLTDDDQFDIDVFEKLACAEHFGPLDEETSSPWTSIRSEEKHIRLMSDLIASMNLGAQSAPDEQNMIHDSETAHD